MRILRYLVTALIVGFTALLLAPLALADEIVCSEKVVDTTANHVLDKSKVAEAIKRVEAFGADVYVRAFQNTPGGNTDAFWELGLRQCSNWRTPDFNAKPNVILVVFGMDRTSAILINKARYPGLDARADAIRANDMNANFKGGEFTDGVTSALDSIAREIDPNKPVDPGTDYSSVWKFFLWIVVAVVSVAALVWLSWLGIRYYGRRQQDKRDRLKAQGSARKAKSRAGDLISSPRDSKSMENEFLVAAGGMPDALIAPHRKTLDDLKDLCGSLSGDYAVLAIDPKSNPDARLTASEYDDLRDEFKRIADGLEDVDTRFSELLRALADDKAKLTKSARATRVVGIDREINRFSTLLDGCSAVFPVDDYSRKLEDLDRRSQSAKQLLDNDAKAWESYAQLEDLEKRVAGFGEDCDELIRAQKKIVGARDLVANQVASRRSVLEGLQFVDSAKPLDELSKVERQADALFARLSARVSFEEQLKMIDQFIGKVKSAGSNAVAKNQGVIEENRRAEEAERNRKKREREEQEAEDRRRRRRSSSGSSSNDSFGGGLAGGYIGSSIGSSGSSSHSSSSSSDFGGSSGGWGGGGFDGGGSSGGW